MYGVDLILPDFRWLIERKDRVDAIVLTHGHEDHTGALRYLVKDINVPIYGSALTLGFARHRLTEAKVAKDLTFIEVSDGEKRKIGPFEVEFIPVTHSVPSAMALAFRTNAGIVVHSGDFKLDLTPIDGRRTDISRLAALGDEGVALLLADSTNAEEPGFTASERSVGGALRRLFLERPERRMVVACFASHIHRVQQIIDVALGAAPQDRLDGSLDGGERQAGAQAQPPARRRRRPHRHREHRPLRAGRGLRHLHRQPGRTARRALEALAR